MNSFDVWNIFCSLMGIASLFTLSSEDPLITFLRACMVGLTVGNVVGRTTYDIYHKWK